MFLQFLDTEDLGTYPSPPELISFMQSIPLIGFSTPLSLETKPKGLRVKVLSESLLSPLLRNLRIILIALLSRIKTSNSSNLLVVTIVSVLFAQFLISHSPL